MGKKYDEGKPKYSLLPWDALAGVADVMAFGRRKYGAEDDWSTGMPYMSLWDGAARHQVAWLFGYELDSESKAHHIDAAIASLLMLRASILRGIGEDDRDRSATRKALSLS